MPEAELEAGLPPRQLWTASPGPSLGAYTPMLYIYHAYTGLGTVKNLPSKMKEVKRLYQAGREHSRNSGDLEKGAYSMYVTYTICRTGLEQHFS